MVVLVRFVTSHVVLDRNVRWHFPHIMLNRLNTIAEAPFSAHCVLEIVNGLPKIESMVAIVISHVDHRSMGIPRPFERA